MNIDAATIAIFLKYANIFDSRIDIERSV